jgi:hypothetical protein
MATLKGLGEQEPLIVTAFRRESTGYFIQLMPKPPASKQVGIGGGGGEVSVTRDGTAKVLLRYQ